MTVLGRAAVAADLYIIMYRERMKTLGIRDVHVFQVALIFQLLKLICIILLWINAGSGTSACYIMACYCVIKGSQSSRAINNFVMSLLLNRLIGTTLHLRWIVSFMNYTYMMYLHD